MQTPFFSVIIPTLNEEVNLPVLLEALAKQTDKDFEVIVSDCLSTDKTVENANSFAGLLNLKLLSRKTKDVSESRNNGAAEAKGQYLVFFDADVEPESDFIGGIRKHIEADKADMLSVWNRPKNAKLAGKAILFILSLSMELFQKIKPAANGPCIIMKKSLFDKIGGFDSSIIFGEDFEIIQRAHKTGARLNIYRLPVLYVSTRRFDKEGLLKSLGKSLTALFYQLVKGPIRKPIFEYEMGGQYYKKSS